MLKQKIFNKQLNQWVDTDVGDGIDAYVLPATTPENAGKTLIFDEKGNAIPVDPQGTISPVAKTEDMTQPVGVDEEGKLYTKAGSGGSNPYIVMYNEGTHTFDKTFADIAEAYNKGESIWLYAYDSLYSLASIYLNSSADPPADGGLSFIKPSISVVGQIILSTIYYDGESVTEKTAFIDAM